MWHYLAVEASPVGQILAHQDEVYYFLTESCSRNFPVFLVTFILEKSHICPCNCWYFFKNLVLESPPSLSSV